MFASEHPVRRRLVLLLAATVVCVCALALTFRGLLLSTHLAPGQLYFGYFEADPNVRLFLGAAPRDMSVPAVAVRKDGMLQLPAGTSVGVPLEGGGRVEMATEAQDRAAYVVLGWTASPPSADTLEAGIASPLLDAVAPSVVDGELRLLPWRPAAPWSADNSRLREIATTCESGPSAVAEVTVDDGRATLRIGRCQAELAFSERARDRSQLVLVALAGPDWAAVGRGSIGWSTRTESAGGAALALLVGAAVLQAVALGSGLTLCLAVLVLVLSLKWPLGAALAVGVGVATSLVLVAVRSLRWLHRRAPVAAWLLPAAAGAGIVAAVIVQGITAQPAAPRNVGSALEGDTCAIVGYSTVLGFGLRRETDATGALLGERCDPCRAGLARRAASGQSFGFIRDVLCGPWGATHRTEASIFLGGNNDDVLWGFREGDALAQVAMFLTRLALVLSPEDIDAERWTRLIRDGEERSHGTIESQCAAIAEVVDCARADGGHFLFAHNFFAMDLEDGRSPRRQEMLTRRRAAVQAAGGQFVDLLAVHAERVGVSWFNDFIHFSAVGHGYAAQTICELVSASR